MSGFDAGNSQGVRSFAKQTGFILRGYGPPVEAVGVTGDLYLDVVSWQLFERRGEELDPWGHYLFVLPSLYRPSLKWFGTSPPTQDIGIPGDYYMQWGGYPNYGMSPVIFGPKTYIGWPQNGDGPGTVIAPGTGGFVLPLGVLDEGTTLVDNAPSQLIAVGLLAEYIIPFPVTMADGDPVLQLGLQNNGILLTTTPNTLYTAEDAHDI